MSYLGPADAYTLSQDTVPGERTAPEVPAFNSNLTALGITCAFQTSRYRTVNVRGAPALLGAVSNTTSVVPVARLAARRIRRNWCATESYGRLTSVVFVPEIFLSATSALPAS